MINPETKAKAQEQIKQMTQVGPPLLIPIWATLKLGWQAFRENWQTSVLMGLIAMAAYLIFYLFAALSGAGFIGYLIYFFIQPLPTMMLVILYFRRSKNQDVSFRACWEQVNLRFYFTFVTGSLFYTIGVMLGLLLLIIPGIYLMACWIWWTQHLIQNYESSNAPFYTKVLESFKASRAQVMRNWCNVFLFVISCFLILILGQLTFVLGLVTYPVAIFAITEAYFIAFGVNESNMGNEDQYPSAPRESVPSPYQSPQKSPYIDTNAEEGSPNAADSYQAT